MMGWSKSDGGKSLPPTLKQSMEENHLGTTRRRKDRDSGLRVGGAQKNHLPCFLRSKM